MRPAFVTSEAQVRDFLKHRFVPSLEDAHAPLKRTLTVFQQDAIEGSLSGQDARGMRFRAYVPTYAEWKSENYPGRRWLQLSGEGLAKRSFLQVVKPLEAELQFRGPDHMLAHQKGQGRMPKREWFGIREASLPRVERIWELWMKLKVMKGLRDHG